MIFGQLNWLNQHAKHETPILVRTDDGQLKLLSSERADQLVDDIDWYFEWVHRHTFHIKCYNVTVSISTHWIRDLHVYGSKKEKVVFHRIFDKIIRCGKLPCGEFVKASITTDNEQMKFDRKTGLRAEWITGISYLKFLSLSSALHRCIFWLCTVHLMLYHRFERI